MFKIVTIFFFTLFFLLVLRSFGLEQISTKALYDFDEARYAEIAKNTVITNNWLIPQASGPDDPNSITTTTLPSGANLHPYFWKPPLHTWIISLAFIVSGHQNELMVRLPSLIFSLLSLIVIFKIAQILFPQDKLVAYLSAVLFSINNDFSFISSQGIAEAQLLFFNLLCLYFLLKPTKTKIIPSGISLGLAIITKSFATFWVFPLALFLIFKYQPRKIITWLITVTMVALPWHLFMYLKFGNIFIDNYVLVNTLGRGLGQQNNLAPTYWYLKYALWQWKTYFIILPLSLFFPKKIFLLIWMTLIFVPFSLVKSKVWWYILPFWTPLCIYLSYLITLTFRKFPKITSLLFLSWIIVTNYLTLSQIKTRTDWNQGIKQLAISHLNLSRLAVYKIPYESPLYYFNSGEISRKVNENTNYIVTNQDYYQQLDPKTWQVIDHRLGDYLLLRHPPPLGF